MNGLIDVDAVSQNADGLASSYFDPSSRDPAAVWPGAPPNWGQQVIPHVFSSASQSGLAGRAYLDADEALRHNPENAERMLADCAITECLEARKRATALLGYHLEPEDPKDPDAVALVAEIDKILNRLEDADFTEMKNWLLHAIWCGRSGVGLQYESMVIGGSRRIGIARWEPRHGDKLVFRYDDGSSTYSPEQVGIKIGVGSLNSLRYEAARRQGKIEYTAQGMVYWIDQNERKTMIIHKHMIEDGIYDDFYTMGRINGVGVRSRIYWKWYAMVECMQRALEYLDRSAFGVELWRYPGNNPQAKRATEEAAKRHVGGGRSVVLVPVFPGEQADLYGVEHIEPGLGGIDKLMQVIKDFFMLGIKRYILGQTLTSEAEATGLGSGVADAHLATFGDIVEFDSRKLQQTLTRDLVRQVQLFNFPSSYKHFIRLVIETQDDDAKDRLAAMKSAWDMGLKIPAADLAQAAGVALPTESDLVVYNPQIVGAMQQMTAQVGMGGAALGQGAGGDPMAIAIQNALQNGARDDLMIEPAAKG